MIFYLRTRTVLDLVVSSQVKLSSNVLPIFVSEEAEEAKIWWNQQVRRRTRSFAPDLSNCGSHCFKLRRMVKGTESIEEISPANEAEGQNTTRASRTKLLENERDSETSTARDRVKHRCGCRQYTGAPNDGIFPNASEVSEMCHSVLGKPV